MIELEEHKVISYDGQVNDYNRYYRRDMICTVKNLSDGSKLTLLKKLQDEKLRCIATGQTFNEKLLKDIEKRLGK